jgi:membrane protein DedA with SNARE-associated domain
MRSRRGSTFSSSALVVLPLALANHEVHGPPIGYAAIALAAALGWFGVPGPGEAALIAAGVFAAEHRLDIGMVIAVAAAGAAAGGVAGWLVGMKASRPVLTGRGLPLRRRRRRLIARGERFFERHGPIGVFLAPSWAAGLHNMRASRFLPLNALAAIGWAVAYGGAAFLLGPDVASGIEDVGAIVPFAAVAVLVAVLVIRRLRRQRHLLRNRKIRLREG